MRKYQSSLMLTCTLLISYNAANAAASPQPVPVDPNQTVVEKREVKEEKVLANDFAITFYKQNYILPFYYTGSPDNSAYHNATPQNESLKNTEISYQLSLKVPVWSNIFSTHTSLYFAYTQLAFWQAYNKTAFFRETDFQPELFVTTDVDWPLLGNWSINKLNAGAIHESNGFGDAQERSWNRVYVEAIASNPNWMFGLRPWYVFHDEAYNRFNPDMANYLGYGEATVAFKFYHQVISLQGHGLLEKGGRYKTLTATYSFPMTRHLNGFVEAFSGYGQSLIEYNHRTNSVGVGILLNNLI